MLNSLVRVSRRDKWVTVYSPHGSSIVMPGPTPVLQSMLHAETCATSMQHTPASKHGRRYTATTLPCFVTECRNYSIVQHRASQAGTSPNLRRPNVDNWRTKSATTVACELGNKSYAHLQRPICLPLSGFTHYFALSSKCFSIFPHGTCSLSDS